jgi:hypothetical protein
MRTYVIRFFFSFLGVTLLFISTSPAKAQCGVSILAFGDVGVVPDNPFSAEIVTTSSPRLDGESPNLGTEFISRDSHGRVRTDHIVGEFLRKSGPEAGTKADLHLILICDPVAQTITQIDPATSTANIRFARADKSHVRVPAASPKPYCATVFAAEPPGGGVQREDLGFQTIEGIQAQGQRVSLLPARPPDSVIPPIHAATDALAISNATLTFEQWCSDSLAAVISTQQLTPKSNRSLMRSIVRSEPDPQLFQIPRNFTVSESGPESVVGATQLTPVAPPPDVPPPNHSE